MKLNPLAGIIVCCGIVLAITAVPAAMVLGLRNKIDEKTR